MSKSITPALWGIFWRAAIYAAPAFILFVATLAGLFILPLWGLIMCYLGEWIKAILAFAGWILTILLSRFVIRRAKFRPLDRYSDGAI